MVVRSVTLMTTEEIQSTLQTYVLSRILVVLNIEEQR